MDILAFDGWEMGDGESCFDETGVWRWEVMAMRVLAVQRVGGELQIKRGRVGLRAG